jgi:hypothetical protein
MMPTDFSPTTFKSALATVLHRMWGDDADFRFGKKAIAA